jgi:hypothetical protein
MPTKTTTAAPARPVEARANSRPVDARSSATPTRKATTLSLPKQARIAVGAAVVVLVLVAALIGSRGGSPDTSSDLARASTSPAEGTSPSDDPSKENVAPGGTEAASSGPSFADWQEHRDEWFFAAMPPGWDVVGATANGIDISPADGTGTASFAYVKGSVAGAMAYGTPTDNAGYAGWILDMQGAQNVRMGPADDLGTQTDAVGLTWTFDAREFDAVAQGSPVHGVLQVGTATDAYGSWVGMAWERVARADRWEALKGDLAAVARSITILKVQSSGGSIRMPAQDTESGEVSATQDDVESRLSQERQDATMGGQSLTDMTTGDRYYAPFTAYDESRGGYFIEKSSGSQELTPDY